MTLPPFQELVDHHGRDVLRFLTGLVGPVDAEDCYQDTLVSAIRAYPSVQNENLRGWLFTIARHKAMDERRRRHRWVPSPVVEVSLESESDEGLWDAVRRLPPKQRSAVLLRYLDGLRYREIGEIIGCSEAAARQNVRVAIRKLRNEVEA